MSFKVGPQDSPVAVTLGQQPGLDGGADKVGPSLSIAAVLDDGVWTVFVSVLTKYPSIQMTEEPWYGYLLELWMMLINLQRTQLIKTLPRQNCCRCGKPHPSDS